MAEKSPKKQRLEAQPESYFTNAIRCLAIDTVQGANSGHPGAPMGMAPISNVLWTEHLKFDPADPHWPDRDRFVLSNGHASALIYSLLHLAGYKLSIDDLKKFRQLHSITPGHPERTETEGVEVTTGPLGQGIANAVGLAIAEAHLAATFNRDGFNLIDHYTYAFCGDGCLMEGVGQEALSLAGHLGLEKLIIVYDDNSISIDGETNLAYTEEKETKYRALGFHTIVVNDGNDDYRAMRNALLEAKAVRGKPKMILLRTIIGWGAKLQGTAKVHGAPLGDEEISRIKEAFGRPKDKKYFVEDDVYNHFRAAGRRGGEQRELWTALLQAYKAAHPDLAKQFDSYFNFAPPADWKKSLPRNDGKSIATRKASENALAALLPRFPNVIGGSADLTGSNLTRPEAAKLVDFQKATPAGRYLRFGVREHAMCAICNGIDAHGGLIAFGATFLNFIGYALGAVRLSAMSKHGCIYVATHDGIGLGEDGPTHQPVELVACLRGTPNTLVFRPADQTEVSASWALAIERRGTPSILCLSRQSVPPLNSDFDKVAKGAYAINSVAKPDLILIGTGTELSLCVEAADSMKDLKVRVVSMPCDGLFLEQPASYRQELLPDGVPVLSVEVYNNVGWDRFSHYHIGMAGWGASGEAKDLYKHFGFTAANIADKGRKLVKHFGGKAPSKLPVEL